MKTLKKISIYVLSAAICASGLNSCSEDAMDDANKRDYRAETVPVKLIVVQGIMALGSSTIGGDMSYYGTVWTELEGGAHNQMFDAEMRISAPVDMATYNNNWNATYYNITTAKDIIAQSSEGGREAGDEFSKGIGYVVYAHSLGVLTDMFGNIPFKQSSVFDDLGMPVYLTPEIDSQESVYEEIFTSLDNAITCFTSGVAPRYTKEDIMYGGDVSKWLKAAYGLKARYALQKINRSANKAADYTAILGYIGNSFTGVADQFSLEAYSNSTNSYTPFMGTFKSRTSLGVSQSYIDKVIARNDYRYLMFQNHGRTAQITSAADLGNPDIVIAIDNGVVTKGESQSTYSHSLACYAGGMPVHLLSYHELLFIKAEVEQRQGLTTAKATLKDAVKAAYVNQGRIITGVNSAYTPLTEALAEDYFDNQVSARFDANPMQEIILEKYMACHGPSGESLVAYNDLRRLKAEGSGYEVSLANPLNTNRFPLRYPYGTSDATTNPNIINIFGDGSYVYSKNVWWAGGDEM